MWPLAERVDRERIATLSFEGRTKVVAEIDGWTAHDVDGRTKWVLVGLMIGSPSSAQAG